MDLGLKGKVAIVAASSKGLGRAVAAGLAREGALVTINGRNAAMVAATAAAIRAETDGDVLEHVADLTDSPGREPDRHRRASGRGDEADARWRGRGYLQRWGTAGGELRRVPRR